MLLTSWVLLGGAVLAAAFLWRPRFADAPLWRAVVTPLASIIGSGFLVAGPILSDAAGRLAWLAMAGLCGLAYLFGTAIRYNIVAVEPLLRSKHPPARVVALERASDVVLAFAYFVSVAYYLNLFAAFGLRGLGIESTDAIRTVTSVILVVLAVLGARGGLRTFESVESWAVGLKIAVIAGVLGALALASAQALASGTYVWPDVAHPRGLAELKVIVGLVVLVQGFETSRFIGSQHDPDTRVRTMRWAQWISTGIYVAFLILAAPYFGVPLATEGGETQIIDMLAPLGAAVLPAVTLAALASQLSAAVADLNGAGGLLAELPVRWLNEKVGYTLTVAAALAITWTSNIYEIIAYASRAFVLYYGLQCVQAMLVARRDPRAPSWSVPVFITGIVLAAIIVVAATPAST